MRRAEGNWSRRIGQPFALGLALAVLSCSGGCDGGSGHSMTPEPAPAFSLPTLTGEMVSLESLRGKTVVIDFWATWCAPCEFQIPVLNEFYEAHREAGNVEVLGISVDEDGSDEVKAWVEERGVAYPILMGDDGLAREYGALGFPALAVVSPEGEIVVRHMGVVDLEVLEAALVREDAGP